MIVFAHTNIITADWRKLADFYVQVFQCKPLLPERNLTGAWLEIATGVTNAHLQGIHLALPGFSANGPTLEIFQYTENVSTEKPVVNRKGFGHIAFRTDDVDTLLEKVTSYGGSCLGDVVETLVETVGLLRFVYARDPDGNIIEIQSWKAVDNID